MNARDEAGRWHGRDRTFGSTDEIAATPDVVAPDGAADGAAGRPGEPAAAPSSIVTPVTGLGEPNDVRAIAIVRCVSCGLSYAVMIERICRACERGEHPA